MMQGLARLSRQSAKAPLDRRSIKQIAQRSVPLGSVIVDAGEGDEDDLPWHAAPEVAAILQDLAASLSGLSSAEASRRLQEYGPNQLTPPRKATFLQRLWAQLNSIVIWILFAAAIIKGAFQSWAAFALVLLVIVVNTAIGLVQEGKAEKAADAIKAMLSPTAKVKRDGQPMVVDADTLVPGDIVLLKSGDKVPADVRLITATNLQVQEAMLTGESVPTSKDASKVCAEKAPLGDRCNMAYSATAVVAGQAEAIVVGTGDAAEIGQISRMVNTVETVRNNLTHQMDIFGRWLSVLVLLIATAALLLAKFRAGESWRAALESAVSIAVAIIPEGLPAMVTVVLALGVSVMAKNHAIVRQMPAVETLGSVNVICSDKTGTLTKNEMTVVRLQTASTLYHVGGVGYAPEGDFSRANDAGDGPGAALSAAELAAVKAFIEGGVLANDSALTRGTDEATGKTVFTPTGAPTEVALLTAAEKAGVDPTALKADKPRLAVVPFESEHKFMATVHDAPGGKRVLYVKGASDRLLPLCKAQVVGDDLARSEPLDLGFWNKAQSVLSAQGLRVLALTCAELPAKEDLTALTAQSLQKRPPFLTMLAFFAILDPPRSEVVDAVNEAHRAGITVKMITGDHRDTALAIGKMLGIAGGGLALTGPEVDALDDAALCAIAPECNIYARASPENKIRIVRALQDAKPRRIVSMTGDGVNDAPALKAADVGVAMGITGTDVSKEAAKMVLADDNFTSIVAAIKEGRRVWDNIVRLLLFNMPCNIAQGTVIMWAYVIGLHDVPLTVLQILLVNMVTSSTLGLALAAEPPEPDVMDRSPRPANKRLIGKMVIWRMLFVSQLIVVLVLGAFVWGGAQGYSLATQRAEAFNVLVGLQISYFVTCRFTRLSTLHARVLSGNRLALPAILVTAAVMVLVTYVPGLNSFFDMAPCDGVQWARIAGSMAVVYFTVEFEKAFIAPVVLPLLRPVVRWAAARAPRWLRRGDAIRRAAHGLCARPRAESFTQQRRGPRRCACAAPPGANGASGPAGADGVVSVAVSPLRGGGGGAGGNDGGARAGGALASVPSGGLPAQPCMA